VLLKKNEQDWEVKSENGCHDDIRFCIKQGGSRWDGHAMQSVSLFNIRLNGSAPTHLHYPLMKIENIQPGH